MTPTNGKSESEVLPGYKGPFAAEQLRTTGLWYVRDSNDFTVSIAMTEEAAQALARCLNSHGAVVEACKRALADRFGGNDPCCDKDAINNELRAAIEAAGGTWQ